MRSFLLLAATVLPFFAKAVTVVIGVLNPPCSLPTGSLGAYASGGVFPYTYSWVGPNGFTATTDQISGLEAGSYTVTVTDFLGATATDEQTLVSIPVYDLQSQSDPLFCDGPNLPYATFHYEQFYDLYAFYPPAPFLVNGVMAVQFGVGGEYAFSVPEVPGTPYTYTLVDGNGCAGTISGVTGYQVEWPTMEVLAVDPACSDGNNGGFTLGIGAEGHLQALDNVRLVDGDGNVVQMTPSLYGADPIGTGSTFVQYTGLPPGEYTFILYLSYHSGIAITSCSHPILVTVPADPGCGAMSGRVFHDLNENCIHNGEPGIPGAILEFTPGPYYATTSSSGNYTADLPLGTYTVAQQLNDFAQHCPPLPTSVNIDATPLVQNLADTALVAVDVALAIASGSARPGFELHYAIDLDAMTGVSSGAMQLVMNVDPAVSYVSASPSPASVVGTTITWNLSQLGSFGHRDVNVTLQVPPDVGLVGSVLDASASVTTGNTDADLSNNSVNTSVTVTASLDPDHKQVFTSSRYSATQYFIGTDDWIDYTIRFQNTGTDTAFAVIIRDTLSADLDPATIIWGAGSHACERAVSGSGLLTFSFYNIMLPDSNVNEPLSHGFVNFRIRPRTPVVSGTVISNAADIYFNFDPPVHTNDAVLTVETGTAIASPTDEGSWCRAIVHDDQLSVFAENDPLVVSLRLVSVDGRVMRAVEKQVIDRQGASLSIAHLAVGAYMLWIRDEKGRTKSFRFVRS